MSKIKIIIILICFILSMILALLYTQKSRPIAEKIEYNCLYIMGKGSCAIMHNEAFLPNEVKQVFISGYGQLDANVYRTLRNSGIYMCGQIKASCEKEKESESCRLGRALYENIDM